MNMIVNDVEIVE